MDSPSPRVSVERGPGGEVSGGLIYRFRTVFVASTRTPAAWIVIV